MTRRRRREEEKGKKKRFLLMPSSGNEIEIKTKCCKESTVSCVTSDVTCCRKVQCIVLECARKKK